MIHSYKGGSGKTLLSLNISNIIRNHFNKRVLLIEADIDGPVYNSIFSSMEPDVYLNQYFKLNNKKIEHFIYKTKNNFDVIFSSPKFNLDDLLKYDDYDGLLDRIVDIRKELISADYDYIIFDLSPGVNHIAITITIMASDIIIVMRPDKNSFCGTKILLDRIYSNLLDLKKKNLYLVFNQIPKYEQFYDLIDNWKVILKDKYPYIDNIYVIPFENETNYNFATDRELLPENDPTYLNIREFVQKVFL